MIFKSESTMNKVRLLFVVLWCSFPTAASDTNIQYVTDIGLRDLLTLSLLGALVYFSATVAILRGKIRQLKRLSLTDELTNIMNRRALMQQVKSDLALSQRMKAPYSVAVCDLDHFKEVNDQYGHDVGDRVLKQTAHVIFNSIRESDSVGRIGGEEFVVLMPNTTIEQAKTILSRIRTNIVTADLLKSRVVTVSIGVTEVLPTDMDFSTIYKRADDALYDAKENGRNRVEDK